jgi:hypothetical protein
MAIRLNFMREIRERCSELGPLVLRAAVSQEVEAECCAGEMVSEIDGKSICHEVVLSAQRVAETPRPSHRPETALA